MQQVNWWQTQKGRMIIILVGVSVLTHFFWLSFPREVVFDEVHFGKFITAYCCTRERFFDIHPPHAKLLIAGTAKLLGFNGGLSFDHIGQPYGNVPALAVRFFPAVSGLVLPLLMFLALRQLGASEAGSFLGGLLVLFDNAVTIQTRIIALDGFLLAMELASLILFLKAEKSDSRQRWRWLMGAGAAAGLAAGTKFTGLMAIMLLGIMLLVNCVRFPNARGMWVKGGLIMVSMAAIVYLGGWGLHFAILNKPGSGDAWGVPQWERPILLSFARETNELHQRMLSANYGLQADHPDSSKWYTWPQMKTSVYYWTESTKRNGKDWTATIYFLGNPFVWWGSTVMLGGFLIWLLVEITGWLNPRQWGKWREKLGQNKRWWIPLLGYVIAFTPMVRIPRALFLYHYLTPLFFALMAGILWMEQMGWIKIGPLKDQPHWYGWLVLLVVIGFLVFSPLTYGFLLPVDLHAKLFWLSTWR